MVDDVLGDLHAHEDAARDASAQGAAEPSAPTLRTTFSREEVLEIARKLSELGEAIDVMPQRAEDGEAEADEGKTAVGSPPAGEPEAEQREPDH